MLKHSFWRNTQKHCHHLQVNYIGQSFKDNWTLFSAFVITCPIACLVIDYFEVNLCLYALLYLDGAV